MKRCGYDGILIQGALNSPGYLVIDDGRISIKDATSIWGLDTELTLNELKRLEGNKINSL